MLSPLIPKRNDDAAQEEFYSDPIPLGPLPQSPCGAPPPPAASAQCHALPSREKPRNFQRQRSPNRPASLSVPGDAQQALSDRPICEGPDATLQLENPSGACCSGQLSRV